MRVVPLNEVKNRLSAYLEMSKSEDIVVTKNGRPAAVLHGITNEDLEDFLFESDPRFIDRIESLRREYERKGGTPLADVRRELGLTGGSRTKKIPVKRRHAVVSRRSVRGR